MKKIYKIAMLNLSIAIAAVAAYSPGLFNLRPSDGIFRAGLSILVALFLIIVFCYGNYSLLQEPKQEWISNETDIDLKGAEKILRSYFQGRTFGPLAKTAWEQLTRLQKNAAKSKQIITDRFSENNLTSDKYLSVVEEAESVSLKNIVHMASLMQLFDESEYASLQHYKEDDIPDDIQEEQIALYEKNIDLIKNGIAANEKIILKIHTLSVELASGNIQEDTDILGEISKLTEEAKYYN